MESDPVIPQISVSPRSTHASRDVPQMNPFGQDAQSGIPSIDISFLFTKALNIALALQVPTHGRTCVVLKQDSWLNPEVADALVLITSFSPCQQDRIPNKAKTKVDVGVWTNYFWFRTYFLEETDCQVTQWHSIICRQGSKIITNYR